MYYNRTIAPLKITPNIHQRAHDLRHVPTQGETKLWSRLRSHHFKDVHFRRQHPIGNYIVDICAPRQKLVIELDGSQHLDRERRDEARSSYLRSRGYRVLRFWNDDVLNNIEGVIAEIEKELIRD